MSDAVQITIIICLALVGICAMQPKNGRNKK